MLAWLLLCAGSAAGSEVTTVYRCVAADGRVALQDRPCPAGSSEQRGTYRVAPADAVAPPSTPAPAEPEPQPPGLRQPLPDAPLPPPPLWACVRHDGSRYESDTGIPERRWVPLWVLGLDLRAPPVLFTSPLDRPSPPPSRSPSVPDAAPGVAALGPGAWVSDACVELPPAEACARYRDRRDALRRRWRLAMPGERDRIRPQERELSAMLRERCGL